MEVSKSGNVYTLQGVEKEIADLILDAVAQVRRVNKESPLEDNRLEAKRRMTLYDEVCQKLMDAKKAK